MFLELANSLRIAKHHNHHLVNIKHFLTLLVLSY